MKRSLGLLDALGAFAAALVVSSLVLVMLDAFDVHSFFGQNWGLAFICTLPLSISCALVGRGVMGTVFGAIMFMVCTVFLMFLMLYLDSQGYIRTNASGSSLAPLVLLCCLVAAVSALQRFRVGSVVLVVLVLGICAVIESMYVQGRVLEFCLALLGSMASVLMVSYRMSLMHMIPPERSEQQRKAFAGTSAMLGLFALMLAVSMACSFAVYQGVVLPLHLPALRIMMVGGPEELDQAPESDDIGEDLSDTKDSGSGLEMLDDVSNPSGDIALLSVEDNPMVFGVLIALLVILAAYCVKRLQRAIRYKLVFCGNPKEQSSKAYSYLIWHFNQLHFDVGEKLTPRELLEINESQLRRFEQGGKFGSFAQITHAFERSYYGNGQPSQQELLLVKRYCKKFARNACRYIGCVRYFLKFWIV